MHMSAIALMASSVIDMIDVFQFSNADYVVINSI